MKKQLLLLAMILLPLVASAHDIEVQNADGVTIYYNYINNGTELEVTFRGSYSDSYSDEYQGNVVIPEEVTYMNRTRKVTSIGDNAFYSCSGLTSVTIGNSVTFIGSRAFRGCSGLTSVTIPNSVTSIGENAFEDCSSLTSVTIPNSVTSIASYAFDDCSALTSITIPNSVTSIGSYAFDDCSALTSVTIPKSVTSIGSSAFENCSGLTSMIVESGNTRYDSRDNCNAIIETASNTLVAGCKNTIIPNSVTSIGGGAFYGCTGLSSIEIPNSVTSIDEHAFSYCSGLTSVTIGNNVTSIGSRAFRGCSSLTSVTIPNSVTTIGSSAFQYCSGLTSVTIGSSVTSLGEGAFSSCSGLTSVTIPNSLKSIGSSAFSSCSGLTSVTIPNSVTYIESGAFLNCSGLTTVTIPNSVKSIGNAAFRGCSGLTSVTIPNSVTSIGEWAFYGCSSLTSVTIPNSVTSIGSSAFLDCSGLTTVTIGSGVTSIGHNAFDRADISTVISLIENPFTIEGKTSNYRTFSQNTFNNATLYVPKGTIDKYKATDGWKDFLFIEEGTGGGDTPETQKCEKPTISYENGKLTFTSETEGAVCQYSITDTDIKAGSGNEVQLGVTYTISVYAAKAGYENSETATATLCWIDQQPKTEGITNGIANIPANAVLIQSEDGIISLQGVDDGTQVNAYTADGVLAGSATSRNGGALLNTNLRPGTTAIVKVGEKSVKIIVK